MRITMGSKELYPTDGKLIKGKEKITILSIKLGVLGGVRDTYSQNQVNKISDERATEGYEQLLH